MDIQDKQDCESSIRRIRALFQSGIFDGANTRHILWDSAFIELMICLRDLMHKAERYATRIAFTEDIWVNNYVKDVTGAITAVRDACCHIDSFKKSFDDNGNRGRILIVGKGKGANIGGRELNSDYDDDMAIFYGVNRLYFRRHIQRAFQEAEEQLRPFLSPHMA